MTATPPSRRAQHGEHRRTQHESWPTRPEPPGRLKAVGSQAGRAVGLSRNARRVCSRRRGEPQFQQRRSQAGSPCASDTSAQRRAVRPGSRPRFPGEFARGGGQAPSPRPAMPVASPFSCAAAPLRPGTEFVELDTCLAPRSRLLALADRRDRPRPVTADYKGSAGSAQGSRGRTTIFVLAIGAGRSSTS